MNIFTDLCVAGNKAVKEAVEENIHYKDFRARKVEAIKNAVKEKLTLFGSVGKA